MSSQPLDRYRVLLKELLFERAAACGELSEDEESRYVASLDELWWQLSPIEQETMERELQASVEVGVEPDLVDRPVAEGTSDLPRRAA
jgi:hypothetical protein